MTDPIRLVISPYLESWDATSSTLSIRVLLIPRGNPLTGLVSTAPIPSPNPSFAAANFTFDVFVTPADTLPTPASTPTFTYSSPTVSTATALFTACEAQFPIDPTPPAPFQRPVGSTVKKYLPISYQNAVGYAPSGNANVFTDCTYLCLLKSNTAATYPKTIAIPQAIPWGKVVAILLRNQSLATAAGLIRSIPVPITDPQILKNGGFVYVSLNPAHSDGADLASSGGLQYYATLLPPLQPTNTPLSRPFFTPVQFPVTSTTPANVDYSPLFAEVDNYNDGWAKAVHAYQPQQLSYLSETPDGSRPAKELGIRLGWDDEQVTTWMNRQISDDPAIAPLDAPLGVAGYRIDASVHGTGTWYSLCLAQGPLNINAPGLPSLPDFHGEMNIETHPNQQDANKTGDFWLPQYFASWHGPSLVGTDTTLVTLGGTPTGNISSVIGVDPGISLTYGNTYDFRVRFADISFGGPAFTSSPVTPIIPGPSPVATIPFRRWIRPLPLKWVNNAADASGLTNLQFKRPLLHYPAVSCTGFYSNVVQLLLADQPLAVSQNREPGLADPDVDRIQITVLVQGLDQDPATSYGFYPIYTTTRAFPSNPADTLNVQLAYVDIADATTMTDLGGSLQLPTARNVRLSCIALCRDDPSLSYFGADDVRSGLGITINMRQESSSETSLYVGQLPSQQISALYCQPMPSSDASPPLLLLQTVGSIANTISPLAANPPDIGSRVATAFGLRNDALTIRAPAGRRVVIGSSDALRHVLGPDGASITFSSQSDIVLHWLVAIKLTLNRDWSWDELEYNGIVVSRGGNEVGRFSPPRAVNTDAFVLPPGGAVDRSQTDLIFFDAIDPKPALGTNPSTLSLIYSVSCVFQGTPTTDPALSMTLTVPITTPPAQIPSIVSAGIALSPFTPAADYSSTATREKRLWIEFSSPPSDPQDLYFGRILVNAPDPLLSTTGENLIDSIEPSLPIDPELARVIVPGQSNDSAGLDAMQLLTPSTNSAVHYFLPLPPGMSSTSPELFGFFTYEFRLGHYGTSGFASTAEEMGQSWSTAQGRFGRPLRCAGVQHPPPPLVPSLQRNGSTLIISVPFAVPVLNSVPVQPASPYSTIWVLLYAQIAQMDNGTIIPATSTTAQTLSSQNRNILLTRLPATPVFGSPGQTVKHYIYGEASITNSDIEGMLTALGLSTEASISVLAVEMVPQDFYQVLDPMGADLGSARILRTSELYSVNAIC